MPSEQGVKIVIEAPESRNWQPHKDEEVIADKFGIELVSKVFTNPAGENDAYFFARKKPGVTVCTITADGNLVLVGQYKQAAQLFVYSFPAGLMWHGNDSESEAISELAEETGYRANEMLRLEPNAIHLVPGKIASVEYLFVATNAVKVTGQSLDRGEHAIEVVEINPIVFDKWCSEGKIVASTTIAAFGFAHRKGYIKI